MLERTASSLLAVRGAFDWQDLGSWERWERCYPNDASGNRRHGACVMLDTRNSTLIGRSDRLVATLGVSDLLVVQTDDATLVCPRSRACELRSLLRRMAGRRPLQRYL